MTPELRRQVLEVYREVDAAIALASPRCEASGRCCRFGEYGHVLYLSGFEAEILLEAAPSYERPVGTATCPFQKDNLCTAREPRPLGCRIYFCDPSYQETGQQITEESLRRLKKLADEHGAAWEYAPLRQFLNRGDASASPTASPEGTSS